MSLDIFTSIEVLVLPAWMPGEQQKSRKRYGRILGQFREG